MSFGSAYETKIDGESMFCDAYCPANGMYCKRLKVICPEHYREPKGSENDVSPP
jgi:COMPASS component SPP1